MDSGSDVYNTCSPLIVNNTKVQALESTLQKSLVCFRELLLDFQSLCIESENYKSQYITQKELCESNNCYGAQSLKCIIESKNKTLALLASILTRLNETKNFSLLDEALRILCNTLKELSYGEINDIKSDSNQEENSKLSMEDISFKEESINEIEGTPTGQKSPIFHSRKSKNKTVGKSSSDFREKQKCPDNWMTPEKKSIKLTFRTPTNMKQGRIKQTRLNLVKIKQNNVVDLTSSPEFSGGLRDSRSESYVMQTHIKKESLENDDTILPSPTSLPVNFTFKATTANRPAKDSKPSKFLLKVKKEHLSETELVENTENNPKDINVTEMEDSINILNSLPKRTIEHAKKTNVLDKDETYFEPQSSMSLLQNVKQIEAQIEPKLCSPTKIPLGENKNIVNTPTKRENDSIKITVPKFNKMSNVDTTKRQILDQEEPLYKEVVPRKKTEKRALPGWLCEQCEYFFGEVYKDDPDMMVKKINECSKHRGRQNPVKPKTSTNFWNPRWSVPEDTEELNRMNDAV